MGVIPSIHMFKRKNPINFRNGTAGKIALIGAFDSEDTTPRLFAGIDELQAAYGDITEDFNGCKVAPYLFRGATSILAVNITTWSSATPPVPTKTITTANLTSSLAKIKGEDWDILFVADYLTDTFLPIITAYLEECFEIKYPAGYGGALNGGSTAANITSLGLAGDHCYTLTAQSGEVDGVSVSALQLAAYYTGLIAGMGVGETMTQQAVRGVTAISPEYTYETGDDGKALVAAGLTAFKHRNRDTGEIIVVNSEQPNGLDLYINRVRDYVCKEMYLHQFLGRKGNSATLSEIEQELERVKEKCIQMDLLEDIEYEVIKKTSKCVDVHITRLLFADIITTVNVYLSLEVE